MLFFAYLYFSLSFVQIALPSQLIVLAFEQVEMPCEYVMKLKPTEYGFCYTFDGTDKNLTFNARTTGSKAGVQFMLWANQSNYYIADEDSAGFKVRMLFSK